LYGRGPADSPYLFEWADLGFRGIKLLAGRNPDTDRDGTPLTRQDLPRKEQGRALIGDPRNDENIIVSQLQLAFIKLHDRVVDRVKSSTGLTGGALLEEAQRRVRWHYQWMVVHDFLPRVCGPEIVASILKNEDAPTGPTVDLQFYSWENQPFMPVEFSAAAFRFGHSMVRPTYDLNGTVQDVPIFVDSADRGHAALVLHPPRSRGAPHGEHLGEVGGRIVAEVLIGLLAGDPSSYLRTQPIWKPDGGIPAFQPGRFTLGDLLEFATP
jgi:Animal haem peroxidase